MCITIALTEHMFLMYLVAKFSLEWLPVGICQEERIRKAMGFLCLKTLSMVLAFL